MKNLMNKIRKANKGFTLVELIIVIAIIAILTAVAAPQYIKYVDKARWSKDQNTAASILTTVEAAAIDCNSDEVTNNDIKDTSVSFSASGIVAAQGAPASLTSSLTDAFGTLTDVKVTNTHKYQEDDSTTYTITVDDDGVVSGEWG